MVEEQIKHSCFWNQMFYCINSSLSRQYFLGQIAEGISVGSQKHSDRKAVKAFRSTMFALLLVEKTSLYTRILCLDWC